MKRNQVDSILVDDTKRRNRIISFISLIIILIIISFSFLLLYLHNNKNYLVNYTENSDVDYKVFLKNNNYFNTNYLDEDNRYIASLIDYVTANFKYELSMKEKDVEYKYNYRIESVLNVSEKDDDKPLYKKTEELLNSGNRYIKNQNSVLIQESLNIDYNKYNDLTKDFISLFNLEDVNSSITLNMYVSVVGSCEEFDKDSNNETVISLVIPLTTKTVGIDIKNNLVEASDKVMICNTKSPIRFLYLFLFGCSIIGIIYVIYKLIRYIIDTRTPKTIYEIELKHILNNYHSYIQKVSNKMNLMAANGLSIDNKNIYKGCVFFKVDSFTDMLEIRDSVNSPILMSSNDGNTATYFIVLDVSNKAVYVYGLRLSDIKKKVSEKIKED